METVGSTLREARKSKGLGLNDLEEITKIRVRYLEALEEDDYEKLPGHTYAIGFIRTYARALGLDPQEAADSFKAMVAKPDQPELKPLNPVMPTSLQPRRGISRGVIISVLCLLALLTLFGVDSVWKKGQTTLPPVEPVSKTPVVSTPADIPQPKTEPAPPVQTPITPETSELSLDILFTGRCWLIINADGQKVFEGELREGTKNIKAKDKIELVSVGSAGAIQLTLNGKQLPSLGAVGQVVKNKILTKNDISQ